MADRHIARSASTRPTGLAGPRSADPVPRHGDGRDRSPAPHTPDTPPALRSFRPPATTRRPPPHARRPQNQPCRTTRSHHRYRDQSPGFSLSSSLRTTARVARPLASLADLQTRPHHNTPPAFIAKSRPASSSRPMSRPPTSACPDVGRSRPAMQCRGLAHHDGPITAVNSGPLEMAEAAERQRLELVEQAITVRVNTVHANANI